MLLMLRKIIAISMRRNQNPVCGRDGLFINNIQNRIKKIVAIWQLGDLATFTRAIRKESLFE